MGPRLRKVAHALGLASMLALQPCCAFLSTLGAPTPKREVRPVSVSSFNVICGPFPRQVYGDLESTTGEEREALRWAINQVNGAVPGLLVYKGDLEHNATLDKMQLGATVFVAPAKRPPIKDGAKARTLAVTMLNGEKICLPGLPIIMLALPGTLSPTQLRHTILHELVHSLGFGHAADGTPISSIMRPAINQEPLTGLSRADILALQAVYGQAVR